MLVSRKVSISLSIKFSHFLRSNIYNTLFIINQKKTSQISTLEEAFKVNELFIIAFLLLTVFIFY